MADTTSTLADLPDGKSFPVRIFDNGDGSFSPSVALVGQVGTGGAAGAFATERIPAVFKNIAAQAVTAGTPLAVWTPATGKKFRVLGFMLSLSVAGSVILKDNTTEILRTPLMSAGVGQPAPGMGNGILSTTINNALQIDVTASGSVSGFVFGIEE